MALRSCLFAGVSLTKMSAMRIGLQFGVWLSGLALCAAAVIAPGAVAGQHRPPKSRPPAHAGPPPSPKAAERENRRDDRPPSVAPPQGAEHSNTFNGGNVGGTRRTQPPNVQERWKNMSPQERQRVLQNEDRLRRLPPAQQQVLRDRAQVWNRMTPQQRDHIRTDVLPRWRQMPSDRKQAIRSRLRVLQNMPESARNQRLSDPNFTRGMSEEDRSTLRDLSHLHVGGGPEPPGE
jgi:hypothetical protein